MMQKKPINFYVDPDKPYNIRHVPLPALLIRLQTQEGGKSVMLTYPWDDIDTRMQRYIDEWNRIFPRNPISIVSKEVIE